MSAVQQRAAAPCAELDGAAREAWLELFGPWIAHRGLWSPDGPPENSLAAFEAARAAGYGIELDVRLSADGEAMVFHDADLQRLTGQAGSLAARTAAELGALNLGGNRREPIPTLAETLRRMQGQTLVLIELKTAPGEEGPLEARVLEVTQRYRGPIAVIGFNAAALALVARQRPGVLRGLNSYAHDDARAAALPAESRRALAAFDHLPASRAHFILPGLDILPGVAVEQLRGLGVPVVAWTTRSPGQHAAAEPYADNLIFEGFAP